MALLKNIIQLVFLCGQDARIFIITCLLEDIDFRDQRNNGHKDSAKV